MATRQKKDASSTVNKQFVLTKSSPFAIKEAYNAVRTKLLFLGRGEKCPVFAVTSALAHDGKSTNAVNLAVSVSMAGKKVLLIDGDMRKPTLHRYFELPCQDGLSEVLAGLTTEVHIRATPVENLSILTAGEIPPNPAELFGSPQMDMLLGNVKQYFDYVIIDTPPVCVVTDATILAEKVVGYVFVVQSGKNHINEVSHAISSIEQMNGKVVGMLLNDSNGKGMARLGYYRKNGNYYRKKYYYYDGNYSYFRYVAYSTNSLETENGGKAKRKRKP